MGNQPPRKRKRLCVYLAGCLIAGLLLWNCTTAAPPRWQAERCAATFRHLTLGECLLVRGDYAGARRQAEHVLATMPGLADDQALYLLGLVLVHPDNPGRDAYGALVAFQRIVAEYPLSPLVAQAQTWLAIIARLEDGADRRARLEENMMALENRLEDEKKRRTQLEERLQKMKDVDLTVE